MDVRRVFAVAKKDILLRLRYRGAYLVSAFFEPMRTGILFLLVYAGFFSSGAVSIGQVTGENYVVFLLLGMLLAVIFRFGFDMIAGAFFTEKIYQTIQGLLISPARKVEIILGMGLRGLIDILPMMVISLSIAYVLLPISPASFLYVMALMGLMYVLVLGVGFINAAYVLGNESISKVFDLVAWTWILLSCFYYPIESTPRLIRPFIELNPVYQANHAIKAAWMNGVLDFGSLTYVLAAAVLSLNFGVFIFNRVWKTRGIDGY